VKIVIYGLTITSSWGNGHATTYRSLTKALAAKRHQIHFVEKDVEWYRSNRDMPNPPFCSVHFYDSWSDNAMRLLQIAADADAILIGSYFPDAIRAAHELLDAGLGPLLFYDIDTPITLSGLHAHGRTDYLDAALIPHFSAYLSFTGGPTLHELRERFGSPNPVPFYCSVDNDLYRPAAPLDRYRCDLSYLGTYAADRQPMLNRFINSTASLVPSARFFVAGSQYPREICWARNVQRIIHVSPREHAAFYSSSRFTLNLTRADMIAAGYAPSVRLFEAAACGVPLLCDRWPGLEEFLTPGEEILLPADEYETASILRHFPEQERRHLGARARERILSCHTSEHRAAQFEAVVAGCYAGRA
jgi:spore maturation protein CgeB